MEKSDSDDDTLPRKKRRVRSSEVQRLLMQTAGGRYVTNPGVGGYNSISVENVMGIEEPVDAGEPDNSDHEDDLYSDDDGDYYDAR